MCLTVYIASDTPLPLIPWLRAAPGFYVSDRVPSGRSVQRHMRRPRLYFVGTHTGCGCGFMYDGVPAGGREHAEVSSMYRSLAEYLRSHAPGHTVQIYSCWGGDEGADPEYRDELEVDDIRRDGFTLLERQLLSVAIGR